MQIFIIAVTLALVVSFICSIFESVLLSISHAQVEVLVSKGKTTGKILKAFKERIDIPISAILITNTAAHTIGTAVAGASYASAFDAESLWAFTLVFTVAVLLFTEIIPKTLGVAFAGQLAKPVALGIRALTIVLKPFVLASELISRSLRGGKTEPITSLDEIRLLATIGYNEGVVGRQAVDIIVGAAELRKLNAANVMVPRQEVTILSKQDLPDDVVRTIRETGHSRFPYSPTGEHDQVVGIVFAKELLAQYSIPLIFMSARESESDRITGFEIGADDYITKPFSPRVLVARVRTLLRRRAGKETRSSEIGRVTIHDISIDPRRHLVERGGEVVDLSLTEYQILLFLAGNPGWVYSRNQIISNIKGDDYPVTERSVDVQILNIRKKLKESGVFIETVRGIGYRMKEEGSE